MPLPLIAVGAAVVGTFWGGSYAGALAKPAHKRKRSPVKTATAATLTTGALASVSSMVGPHVAVACGMKAVGTKASIAATSKVALGTKAAATTTVV